MTGKTHKFIGIVAGGALAYYGVVVLKNPLYSLTVVSAPIGAMIADIDHNNSKIGASRKYVLDVLTMLFRILIPVSIAVFLMLGYIQGTLLSSCITLALVIVPFEALFLLTKINFVKKNLNFVTKHRGLMHTLILPLFMYLAVMVVVEPTFSILLQGLFLGYCTHLFADLLTIRGCPILYPISKQNIRFAKIRTGTVWEYIAAGIISGAIVFFVFFLQANGLGGLM